MKELVQLEGDKIIKKISLQKSRYSLGRDLENDLVFDGAKVSRVHALLVEDGDTYCIVDQDSKNHVFVNGERVKKKRLTSGDKIDLSQDISLVYLIENEVDEKFTHILNRVWEIVDKQDFLRLKEVTDRIISLDSLEDILDIILANVIRLVNAERGFIVLTDEQGKIQTKTSVSHHLSLQDKDPHQAVFARSIVQQAIQSRENVFLLNTEEEADHLSDSILELDLRSVMCAPLIFGNQLVGLLYVDSSSRVADFNEVDQFVFATLSDYAAIAIKNAKLYNQVQRSNQELRAEIEESEARYRQVVEFSPEAIAVHSEGKILFVNPAAVKLLGAEKPENLIGTPVFERVHPDFRDVVVERIRMENEGYAVPPLEERFLKLDGTPVEVEVIGVPFVFRGRPASLVIFRDISQRKRMEQELLRAQKLESVGVLAGGIAHDFNNILQVIRGNALMAKVNMDDKENMELCLTAIEKAVSHAVSLTSQLLTFSKGGTPVTKATSLESLIEESAGFALRGSNVAYTLDFAEDLYFAEVDSDQINQVIHNLVLNADQAMPAGGTVTISASNYVVSNTQPDPRGLKEGRYVKISVKDQGVGMSEETLERIFDPYFTTKEEGSGLGLASCYSIVTKHGGIIEAESEEGKGSIFTLYIPASGKQPEKKEATGCAGTLAGKILLMDDEDTVRDTAGRMLQRIGCAVETAADGVEAIERYLQAKESGEPFDLVIFDLTIPGGMGGRETIARLREHDPQLKAIVASGYSNDPVMASPEQYGFQGVISKPFNVEELARVIEKALSSPTAQPVSMPGVAR